MPGTIGIGALLEPGLRNEASQVYMPLYTGVKEALGEVIWLEGTSDKFQEVFGFLEAPSYFAHWPQGTPPPSGSIKSQRYTITNEDFARRQYLPRNYEDDQTGTAMQFARAIAQTYGLLPWEIFAQHTTGGSQGATAPYPVAVTSADGNAIYYASTRYGSSGGNIVTQTGVTTVQQVWTDIFSIFRRFSEFLNTQSRPFFNPMQLKAMSLFYGSSNTLVMAQAESQTLQHSVISSTGAAVTNILKEHGLDIKYVNMSTYISNSAYYVFLRGLPNHLRPMWRQVRKGYTEWQGNFVTSDHSRDTGELYVQGDCREGWGSVLALGTIKCV